MARAKKSVARDQKTNEERKVVYDECKSIVCKEGADQPPIDVDKAKQMLGWQEEEKEGSNVKYGSNYLVSYKDTHDKVVKVRCRYNVNNRPFYQGNCLTLVQEILRGRWRWNGEPIILGKYGAVLNGQHQLVALVLANIEYAKAPGNYPAWKSPPTIDKTVTVGVEEDDQVINTMDTCKPRSLADVIYRSEYFSDLPPQSRRKAATVTDHACRLLWVRTGENLDGFSSRRTHSEMVDFIDRHRRVMKFVRHVISENEEGKLSRYLSPGYLAALGYLFAASSTDPHTYLNQDKLCEDKVDFSRQSDAEDFIVKLAADDSSLYRVKKVMAATIEDDASNDARIAILIKAWNLYAAGKTITEKALKLEYTEDEEGWLYLTESPSVGGIDIVASNSPSDAGNLEMVDEALLPHQEPDKNIKEKAKAAKQKNGDKPASTKKEPQEKKPTKPKKQPQLVGKARYYLDDDGQVSRGKVVDIVRGVAKLKILTGYQGAGNHVQVPVDDLYEEQPSPAA